MVSFIFPCTFKEGRWKEKKSRVQIMRYMLKNINGKRYRLPGAEIYLKKKT